MKRQNFTFGLFAAALALSTLTIGCTGSSNSQVTSSNKETNTVKAGSSGKEIARNANDKTVRIGAIDWYVEYEDAMAAAKESNRPVWLHFGENPG